MELDTLDWQESTNDLKTLTETLNCQGILEFTKNNQLDICWVHLKLCHSPGHSYWNNAVKWLVIPRSTRKHLIFKIRQSVQNSHLLHL